MSVREQDLVLLVGGEALERYGVLVRRTSPTEDEPETYTRAGTAPMWDKDGYVRQVSANTPRPSWLDLDGDGIPETPVLPLSGAQQNLCEFNIPGGTPADTELVELDAVTNLAGEYAMRVNEGADYDKALGASWDANQWEWSQWVPVDWASTDGEEHVFLEARKDASNLIRVYKSTSNDLRALVKIAGADTEVTLSPTWAAGDTIFIGADFDGTTLTLRFDTDGDNALETATDTPGATFASSSGWTAQVGADSTPANHLEGALNLLITNSGTADPITDRFNGGVGMALAGDDGWLARHGSDLVLGIGGNEDGSSVEIIGQDSITDHLDQTDGGRYSFGADSDLIDLPETSEFDGITDAAFLFEFESDDSQLTDPRLFRAEKQADLFGQVSVSLHNGQVYVYFDGGANHVRANVPDIFTDGERVQLLVNIKLGEAVDTDKVEFFHRTYTATSKQYGAWAHKTNKTAQGTVPSSVSAHTAGNTPAFGGTNLRGKLDDVRWVIGSTFDPTTDDASIFYVNEANPAHWDHWYPFDTDASDFIGSLDGTVTGATLVDDGRHHIGGMHRFVKQGVYYGSSGNINHGSYAALDGASRAVFDIFIRPEDLSAGLQYLFERGRSGADGQIGVRTDSTDGLRVFVPTSATDTSTYATVTGVFADGVLTRVRIEYDGTLAAANRIVVKTQDFDPATGTWSTLTSQSVSISGTIPTTLRSPSGSPSLRVLANSDAGTWLNGFVDRFAAHAGSIPAEFSIYEDGSGVYDIWADYDGDATNAGLTGASNDGSVTDVLQWYDGRQPEGWAVPAGVTEIDRSTDNATAGTWGVRLVGNALSGPEVTPSGLTTGRWFLGQADMKAVTGSGALRTAITNAVGFENIATESATGAMTAMGGADRVEQASSIFKAVVVNTNDEIYMDNLRAWEFTPQSFDTATAGPGLPAIDGKGGAWGIADAESVTASAEGIDLPYDSSLGTTIVKLTTGPAGTGTRRYLFGLPGEMNGFTASTLAGMVVDVFIPTDSEVAPADVGVYATDDQATTTGDSPPVRGKWCKCWVARTWNAGATEAYFELRFADGVNLSGADEVLYMALPTIVSGSVPVVAIPNAGEGPATAIAAETFYTEYRVPPVASALYAKWTAWGPGGILYLGGSGDTGARIWIEHDSDGKVAIRYSDGTTELEKVSTSTVDWGAEIRFLGVLTAEGTIQAHLRIDQGALESTTVSAELELPDDWGDTRAYVGSQGGTNPAAIHLHATKAVRTSGYTLDEVEAVR